MISRLRMGHTGLNSTLALMGKHENGMCDECDVSETVEHVLYMMIRVTVFLAI